MELHYTVPARASLLPLIDLRPSAVASASAQAVTHWLEQPQHDAWGASMYLHGPTRRLYRQAGVDLEVHDWRALPGRGPRWKALHQAEANGQLDPGARLYLARLLCSLAFYPGAVEQARRAGQETSDPGLGRWAVYVEQVAHQMQRPLDWDPTALVAAASDHDEPALGFRIALRVAAHHVRVRDDPATAHSWLTRARGELRTLDGEPHELAQARLARHEAGRHLALGDALGFRSAVAHALQVSRQGGGWLRHELARRIRAFAAAGELRSRNVGAALEHARAAVALDPHCTAARMLAAEVARLAGQTDEARQGFTRCRLLGTLELPLAATRLAQSAPREAREHAAAEALDCNYYRDPAVPRIAARVLGRAGADTETAEAEIPLAVSTCEPWAARCDTDLDLRQAIQQTDVYERLRTLWTLEDPRPGAPLWSTQPANAWHVHRQQPDPHTATLYFQSTHGPYLRDSLLWAAAGRRRLTARGPLFGETLESLRGASSRVDEVLDAVADTSPTDDPLTRASLSRVLCYLGLFADAQRLVPIPWKQTQWSASDCHAIYANLLYRYLVDADEHYWRDCERVYARIPDTELTLRLRLTLCIQAGGLQGKRRKLDQVEAWRQRGEAILARIQRCSRFDPTEVALLTSRWWRFASFLPFLRGDRAGLIREATIYEDYARAVNETSRYCHENMYAALETRARVQVFLGNLDQAEAAFLELATHYDPNDAKVWLNLGDLAEKRGRLTQARQYLFRSARLGPPHRELAWYRAGLCCERLDDPHEAIACHLRSLDAQPNGYSPLIRLAQLARHTGDDALRLWAKASLADIGAERRQLGLPTPGEPAVRRRAS